MVNRPKRRSETFFIITFTEGNAIMSDFRCRIKNKSCFDTLCYKRVNAVYVVFVG